MLNGDVVASGSNASNNRVALDRVIGAPVYTFNRDKVGSISSVLVNEKAQATGIVIQTDQNGGIKHVLVNPQGLEFDKFGSGLKATIKLDRGQFDNLLAVAPPKPTG